MLFSKSYSILLLVILCITSCKLGKEYQQPALELPQQFNALSFADTSSIADLEWKVFFTDPVLQALIERGIAYNHDLLIAINNIDMAEQYVMQAKSRLPYLEFQIAGRSDIPSKNSLSGISTSSFLGQNHLENYTAGVNLSWEVDIWKKLRNHQAAVQAEYLQSYEAAKAVQTQLVADISNGYFNLLMLDKQIEIARKNLALADTFLTATRLLRDAGIGNALAIQQAEAQKLSTALLIPGLEQGITLQENALQMLTGQLPGPVSRQASFSQMVWTDTLSAGLPIAMVSRRPDVRTAEMELMAVHAQVGIALANRYPALNITVGGGLESFKASNWFSIPNSLFGLVAGSLTQPLMNRRELKTDYEVVQLQREQAVIQFRQSVLRAVVEVSNAFVQLDKLGQQQQIAITQVDTLQRAVSNAKLLFRSDLANYLEVITAQGNALQAELNLAAIQRQQLSAKVELYRALGGGWK